MMQSVPFMDIEDEPRIKQVVLEMMQDGVLPEYKVFFNEPESKKRKRHRKYAKERAAAAKELETSDRTESLEQQIMKRQQERKSSFSSLIDKLSAKYSNGENESDDPEFEISNIYVKNKRYKKNACNKKAKRLRGKDSKNLQN